MFQSIPPLLTCLLQLLFHYFITGGKFGNRLRYAAVVVNTSLTGATLKYKEGNEVYQNWENFINTQVLNSSLDIMTGYKDF